MKNKTLSWKVLGILTIVAYGLRWLLGDSVVGGAFALLGLLLLIFTVIAAVREWRDKKKQSVPTMQPPTQT